MIRLDCISLKTGSAMPIPEKTVLCLGNFDGVHLGHKALMQSAIALRDDRFPDALCGVFCFRELSSDLLIPQFSEHLSTGEERNELFCRAGLDFVILADFADLRDLSPLEFATEILQDQCHCAAAVCGFNYRFGKRASGTAQTLRQLLNVPVLICPAVVIDGEPVSSTRIREAIREGKVAEAARLLGYPYTLCGSVKHGKELGRKLGFPTANQDFPPLSAIPRHGVYATDCFLEGERYRGVSNVGNHPTVDAPKTAVNCETYLIGYAGDLYGKHLKVEFLQFLRPEQAFATVEDLQAQIAKDAELASKI